MAQKYLPHIYRSFSAKPSKVFLSLTVWVFVTIFFFYLISFYLRPLSSFERLKIQANNDYQNPKIHFELAEKYKMANDLENARREIMIALSYAPTDEELKWQLRGIGSRLNQPEMVLAEISTWEKIAQDFPGYRDAYLKLTALYYQLYQTDKAKENLGKVLGIDPNFQPARELEKRLRD